VFTADGNDLAELLIRNGLASIYGSRTPLPDDRDSRTYLATLREIHPVMKLTVSMIFCSGMTTED
jgi:hypothetical protein